MKSLPKILFVMLLLFGATILMYQPSNKLKQLPEIDRPLPQNLEVLDSKQAATIFNSQQDLTAEQTKTLFTIMAKNGNAEKSAEDAKKACEKSYDLIKDERDKRTAAENETSIEKKKADKKTTVLILATLIFGSLIFYSRLKEDEGPKWKKIALTAEFVAAAFYILLDRIMSMFGF